MKIANVLYLALLAGPAFAQNGYVKFENDSIKTGFLRHVILPGSQERGIELWESKKDKDPLKLKKRELKEYAIKRDTFKILNHFRPFQDRNINFPMAEAKVIARGKKLELLSIDNSASNAFPPGEDILISLPMGSKVNFIYVLADVSNYFPQGIPATKPEFENALMDFFSTKFLNEYRKQNGKLGYSDLPNLVNAYNALK